MAPKYSPDHLVEVVDAVERALNSWAPEPSCEDDGETWQSGYDEECCGRE